MSRIDWKVYLGKVSLGALGEDLMYQFFHVFECFLIICNWFVLTFGLGNFGSFPTSPGKKKHQISGSGSRVPVRPWPAPWLPGHCLRAAHWVGSPGSPRSQVPAVTTCDDLKTYGRVLPWLAKDGHKNWWWWDSAIRFSMDKPLLMYMLMMLMSFYFQLRMNYVEFSQILWTSLPHAVWRLRGFNQLGSSSQLNWSCNQWHVGGGGWKSSIHEWFICWFTYPVGWQ